MIHAQYDWRLVALSVAIAITASYTALDLAGRIASSRGGTRLAWLIGGAVSMGLGIWAMHYIGMLAYRLPLDVFYSLPVVGISLLAAIVASAVALYVVSGKDLTKGHLVAGSLTMGTGVATMHYVGMHAMRVGAHRTYSHGMVALSIIVAIAVSGVALFLAFRLREENSATVWSRPVAAVVMGFAVAAMHYIGMAAVCFHDMAPMSGEGLTAESSVGVFGIATVTFSVLAMSLVGSMAKSRFMRQQRLLDAEQSHRVLMEKEIAARIQAEAEVRRAYDRMGELVAERTAELQQSQAMWVGLVEALPQLVWVMDPLRHTIFVSDACVRYSGLSREQLLGQRFIDHVHPDDREILLAAKANAFATGSGYDLEVRLRSKGGAYRWFMTSAKPISDVEGQPPTRWIGSSTDIDDQKRSKELLEVAVAQRTEALEEAVLRAECAMRAKSDFLAVMSHEIRTPMNGVIGMAQLLRETPLYPVQQGYLDAIRSSGQALLTIINDILDFSKIEAGKLEIYEEDFNLGMVTRECMDLLAPAALPKGLALSLDLGKDLPPQILGDSGRLRQILLNLLSNAVKFTHVGTVSLTVSGRRREDGTEMLRFAVRDSGIGLTPQQIGTLFQAFTQADHSTTRRFGGTGLGLSIAKRLVELMGGEVGVESRLGEGSTFWFDLPLKRGADVSRDTASPAEESRVSTKDLFAATGFRVLVADDVVTNQMVACGLLKGLGLCADAVSNGAEAIAILDTIQYDLVLMDVHMPEMDGLEATRRIRERMWDAAGRERRLPIIALTASAMPGDRQKFLEAGMDDFISKPIMAAELVTMLRKWLPAGKPLLEMAAPAPAVSKAACVFDRPGLLGRVMGDEQLAHAVIEGFALDMPQHVDALARMMAEGTLDEVADLAHRIRGAAATVGGEAVRAITEEMESAGRAGDRARVVGAGASLRTEFGRLLEALERDKDTPLAA